MRVSALTTVMLILIMFLYNIAAEASFVRFYDCVQECRGSYWRRVAWTLDCELELAKCIITLGDVARVAYHPTLENRGVFNLPTNPESLDVADIDVLFAPESLVNVNLQLLNPKPNYIPGKLEDFNTEDSFNNLITNNLFEGRTTITNVEIKAMPISDAKSFGKAADDALNLRDSNVGLQHPLWDTADLLYSGDSANIQLDTSSLTGGTFILRIMVKDLANGEEIDIFALSSITLSQGGITPVEARGKLAMSWGEIKSKRR